MATTYTFHKDAATNDGLELHRFLEDGGKLAALAAGSYAITSGPRVGPGSLGVVPANVSYRLLAAGGYTLVIT